MNARSTGSARRLLLIAGEPSHGRGEHEFAAGTRILQRCLEGVVPGLAVEVHEGGWVDPDDALEGADAIVIYADGDTAHPLASVKHRERVADLVRRGIGFGCLHYAVAAQEPDLAASLDAWLGGHYQDGFSCNPKWEARFDQPPDHPVTSGVRPFAIHDEWYFNLRLDGAGEARLLPILVATPSDDVREGPYVHPPGPYPHIVAASGRSEILAWAVERRDGGRGFGFTGGHYHANWGDDDVRRLVLNALVWLSGASVPQGGVASQLEPGELDAALP